MATQEASISARTATADLWRHTLLPISSLFGRLVYLSQLFDRASSRYSHHGLAIEYGEAETHNALRKAHRKVVAEWLSLSLEQQKQDFDEYLSSSRGVKRTLIGDFAKDSERRALLPESAKPPERRLFLAHLEAIVHLLKQEYGVETADQGA